MAMDYLQYDGTVPRHSTSYKGNNVYKGNKCMKNYFTFLTLPTIKLRKKSKIDTSRCRKDITAKLVEFFRSSKKHKNFHILQMSLDFLYLSF